MSFLVLLQWNAADGYRVEEGQFYEAHQQLRVIANRYVKSTDYPSAVDVLSSGASMLLKAGQGGSGGDLCMFLMDVYGKAQLKPDVGNKARVLALLRAFPSDEPTRKRFVGEIIGSVPRNHQNHHNTDMLKVGHRSLESFQQGILSCTMLLDRCMPKVGLKETPLVLVTLR